MKPIRFLVGIVILLVVAVGILGTMWIQTRQDLSAVKEEPARLEQETKNQSARLDDLSRELEKTRKELLATAMRVAYYEDDLSTIIATFAKAVWDSPLPSGEYEVVPYRKLPAARLIVDRERTRGVALVFSAPHPLTTFTPRPDGSVWITLTIDDLEAPQ